MNFVIKIKCSVKNVFRALKPFYDRHKCPTDQAIQTIVTKLLINLTLDVKPPTRVRRVRTQEKIGTVNDSVAEEYDLTIACRS